MPPLATEHVLDHRPVIHRPAGLPQWSHRPSVRRPGRVLVLLRGLVSDLRLGPDLRVA